MNKHSTNNDVVTIRFSGDSGDGMQLTGNQFSDNTAIFGNDLNTLPDFPAEIRAPAGSLFGVSSFQLQFGNHDIYTAGDDLDVLVSMNPAALKVHLPDLKEHGLLIVNTEPTGIGRNLCGLNIENRLFSRPIIFASTLFSFKILESLDEIFSKVLSLFFLFIDNLSTTNFLASGFNFWKDKSSNSSLI